jgi:hypothetical protein
MRAFSVFFVLIISINSFSQQVQFQQNIGWKGAGNSISLHSFTNADESLVCLALLRYDSLTAFLLDKNMKLIKTTGVYVAPDEEFFGGFISDNKISFLFNKTHDKQVFNWIYNIDSNSFESYLIPFDLKGKKTLGHIGVGNFYYITTEKREPVINVFKFKTNGSIDQQDYDLSNAGTQHFDRNELWQALSKTTGIGSRDVDISVVQTEADCSIEDANAPNKIYCRNDTLLLLMDNQVGRTQIFSFDLARKKINYKSIERKDLAPANDGIADQCVYNSFLSEDKLYYVCADEKSLSLVINNFSDGKEIARFSAGREEEIAFKNTPILQDGGGTIYSANAKRELDKTKQFLKKLLAGRDVITAYRNQYNQCEITVGAYKQMQSTSGGWTSFGGGAPVYTGGVSSSWKRVTRFKSIIDTKTLEHISGEAKPSLSDIINDYTMDINIPSKGERLLWLQRSFFYAYYDKNDKSLKVVKL